MSSYIINLNELGFFRIWQFLDVVKSIWLSIHRWKILVREKRGEISLKPSENMLTWLKVERSHLLITLNFQIKTEILKKSNIIFIFKWIQWYLQNINYQLLPDCFTIENVACFTMSIFSIAFNTIMSLYHFWFLIKTNISRNSNETFSDENFAQETQNVVQSFFLANYERENERNFGANLSSDSSGEFLESMTSPSRLCDTPIVPEFRVFELSRILSEWAFGIVDFWSIINN